MKNLFLTLAILALSGCGDPSAFAKDSCQDPNNLPPKLKKAYYELKRASQELGGFSVSIKCYPSKRKDYNGN